LLSPLENPRLSDHPPRSLSLPTRKPSRHRDAKGYPSGTTPALVIKSFPEALDTKLRQIAASHRRSVTQETIHLIELAISTEEKKPAASAAPSYWATRKLLPEFEAALKAGAFSGGTDSTQIISEERDAR